MPETAAPAVTPARVYPIPDPPGDPGDPRFGMRLLLAFRDLLAEHGYPRATEGVDLLHLQAALFTMLYAHPEPVDDVRHLQTPATPICLIDTTTLFCRTHQGQHPDGAPARVCWCGGTCAGSESATHCGICGVPDGQRHRSHGEPLPGGGGTCAGSRPAS